MARLILITGLIPYDSGKTWFTLGSALVARSLGLKVRVFKPVAGHSLWYSPRTIKKSVEFRLLVGNDITLYYENGFVSNPAVGNPIAVATAPPDPCLYKSNPEAYIRDLEDTYATIVFSRITDCFSGVTKHYFYPENLNKTPPKVKKALLRAINFFRAEESTINNLVNYMLSKKSEENLNTCFNQVEQGGDVVFIESFNDAITPYADILRRVDVVAIVAPGRVLVYENVKELNELVNNNVKKLGWEGYRSRYIAGRLKAQTILNTGFAIRPRPRDVHKLFIETILRK